MQLVLASASPARKELLSWLEIPFAVLKTDSDETVYDDEEPSELVVRLASQKAEAAAQQIMGVKNKLFDMTDTSAQEESLKLRDAEVMEGVVVLAADTTIEVDGKIMNKPANKAEAQKMIEMLSGKSHKVLTGVCVIDVDSGERMVEYEESSVLVRNISSDEIQKYLETNEWKGKAGGYQIQKSMKAFVQDIEGSYTSIVGLPLLMVEDMLERVGMAIGVNVREVIEDKTGYES